MANIIYNKFLAERDRGAINLTTAVVRCLLERSTSAYSPNKDHEFVSDLTNIVEISVASYARQTVGSPTVTADNTNDRSVFDFADIVFGDLEAGQTVLALIFYVQTGGNDATPNNDILIARIDTATGLPAVLGGGAFNVQVNVNGFLQTSQP